jgi:sulfur-carrier protein adenylyltransferase/sulfurtransferase
MLTPLLSLAHLNRRDTRVHLAWNIVLRETVVTRSTVLGVIMSLPPLVEPAAELSVDEVRRYSRHIIIPDVGMIGQKRLKNARVLCVGAGGLGSPALMYLAAAGVGTIGIVEFDVVDESNLQRQIIHSQSDIGRSKAQSAADTVRGINPYVQVNIHELRLDSTNVMELFSQYDLIVDGTDNFATRYLVNDACVLLNKPYVWGSIYRFDGQASVFWSEHGPCYRCLYPEPPPPGMVPSCAEGGVLGVLCAAIGSIQVNEAIKVLAGIGEPLVGSLMVYDALEMTYRKIKIRKDPNCAICGENPTVTELIDYEAFCGAVSEQAAEAVVDSTINVKQLAQMLEQRERGERDFVLIDVREPNEFEIVSIPGSVLIPKNEFLMGDALASLPQDKQVVLHCKVGGRSAEVLAVVKGAGFADAIHVGGGVIAWVNQIEPEKPTY